ncbi:MAG: hypothetical protein COA79_11700 [Planctomycetota bacterium]|nr:MAG: hypothetical protein COA79_11700 [Planctomycetota bacterium]
MIFNEKDTILFMGDSITDGARTRSDPNHLGLTYVGIAAGMIQNYHPELRLKFYNRGVGGDSIRELKSRWKEDALSLQPDWLSISIGINDVWRNFKNSPNGIGIEEFKETYHHLIKETKNTLPNCKIILCETSIIWQDLSSEANQALEEYNEFIRQLATDNKLILVRMQDAFRKAITSWPDYQWTNDGVHTSCEGSTTMALAWLKAVEFSF